jgi:hypothetical protein
VGFFPTFFPPEPRLAKPAIRCLPLPVDRSEFVAFRNERGPDLREHTISAPPLKPAMDRAIVAELLGQPVPLTSGAEAEDDAVEGGAQIDARSAAVCFRLRRRVLQEDWLDALPEFVANFPNRVEGLYLSTGPSHPCVILMRELR